MRRGLVALGFVLVAGGTVAAGELVLANGTRLEGELANEALLVSTAAGLVELVPEDVVTLTREEIQLRDGRQIRGTLVGGRLKARTALGEIAIRVDELDVYRGSPAATPSTPAVPAASSPPGSPGPSPASPSGVPLVTAYQGPSPGVRPAVAPRRPAPVPEAAALGSAARQLEVVVETLVHREALSGSAQIGHVTPGQQVTYVDSIDRRLRILNRLIFDGGHWVKVRLADGTEGWVPADRVRELR